MPLFAMQSEEKWKHHCGRRWQAGCAGYGVLGETECPKQCAHCVTGAQRLERGSCRTWHPAGGRERVGEGTVHVLGAESTPQ